MSITVEYESRKGNIRRRTHHRATTAKRNKEEHSLMVIRVDPVKFWKQDVICRYNYDRVLSWW